MDGTVILLGVLLLAVAVFLLYRRHRRLLTEAYARLLQRDGLLPTAAPCGRKRDDLTRLWACPKGDRRRGIELGVTGPAPLTLDDTPVTAECAAFVWWWEEEHRSTDSKGHTRTSYSRRSRVVGMLRVPYWLPSVTIGPEGLLNRVGIGGRGDFQVESEEFNRRFEVRLRERELGVRLLDARFQQFLLELFDGRQIELDGDVIVVAGDPAGRDAELYGDVQELPGARRDVQLVAARIPASFWRALRHADRTLTGPDEVAT